MAAPLLHAITAGAIYALAGRLYGKFDGVSGRHWFYITLPAVAYSSLIISTRLPC